MARKIRKFKLYNLSYNIDINIAIPMMLDIAWINDNIKMGFKILG